MFAIKSLTGYLFGKGDKENVADISQGQLYIVRPLSPKGYSELIFKDAAAYIRRTGQEFHYQLVIQRAYEEGEEDLLEEEGGEEGAVATLDDKDEKIFLLDEHLHFRTDLKDNGEIVLAWRDLSGDEGDLFEFVCADSIRPETVTAFGVVAAQCQFERKYRRGHQYATEGDLKEFAFDDEPDIPTASPRASPLSGSRTLSPSAQTLNELRDATPSKKISKAIMARDSTKKPATPAKAVQTPTKAPAPRSVPTATETLAEEEAELYLFDFASGTFVPQDENAQAIVAETGNWTYWLQITGEKQQWLGQEITPEINPVFNFEYLSFIFNHYAEDGSAYSWLLKFKDRETEESFQEGLMQALWEHLNQAKWKKAVKDAERDYVLDAFNDLVIEDPADDEREREAAEEDDEEDEFEDAEDGTSEPDFDSDEDEDEPVNVDKDGNINSQLAVGANVDRSFVVRGNKIGVFKHTEDNKLEFNTSINNVANIKGKKFAPSKVMLHAQDRNMVLQNPDDPNSVYRMDLEVGKVVDEWKVSDDIPINIFAPESKFAQTTGEQTFLGLSKNALYRVDPRLSGNKLVDSELKQYVSKNDFSAAATTEKGYIAVASNKGDIRLFDRLGINAKTALPALGDPIVGMDVSADGKWLLATTRTYLLLIDTEQKEGSKYAGKLGFEKPFSKDHKPQPRRLGLTPQHIAQFQHETGAPLSFTTARFNTGEGKEETTIITATGPFIVTWSLKKVLAGRKDPYHIKRYAEEVKADNFRFNSDKNIVVALPNEVDMVRRAALQRPTRESIMATPKKTKGRGSYLSRNEIVNSPY
ncbi:hypothetical protein CERZMDRAFT_85489 [Cercospora zeae-maydis SCOH1-5]|uniref:Vacuolar import/degradation Vid27 C-terminal domain-containing protein n=1 Tax=Cercospora zeae-maydis SCOH1-5 TaxID=717836 RepID=A0A6A6FD18_9PEZI|nr:hypothetical protein CERZMDRAFT_85489 [Cercospora zeae-maydis SCOH1-5]